MKEELREKIQEFWKYKKWPKRLSHGVSQFKLLVSYGLEPHHFLLDVGCGWLRGGIYSIDYLHKGHYFGFDKEEKQLVRGEVLLEGVGLGNKKPIIGLVTGDRDLGAFVGKTGKIGFDYMIANSVFTHVDPYMASRLFSNVTWFLKEDGKFLASFYRAADDKIFVGKKHWSRSNEYGSVIYPFQFFVDLAHDNGLSVDYIDDEKDEHRQNWMCFYKGESDAGRRKV